MESTKMTPVMENTFISTLHFRNTKSPDIATYIKVQYRTKTTSQTNAFSYITKEWWVKLENHFTNPNPNFFSIFNSKHKWLFQNRFKSWRKKEEDEIVFCFSKIRKIVFFFAKIVLNDEGRRKKMKYLNRFAIFQLLLLYLRCSFFFSLSVVFSSSFSDTYFFSLKYETFSL